MTFFARPNLEDIQFVQESGSVLTLSGQTRIATTTGLTLSTGSGTTIAINAKGAAVGNVMTYDGIEIKLMPSSSGGSSGIYYCKSPTTCTVGGLLAGTSISGCSISKILEEILVPTLNPVLTAPFSSFSVPVVNPYEVGASVSLSGTINYDRGCINPQYTSTQDKRSCGSISFCFCDFNGLGCTCSCNALTSVYPMPAYSVVAGTRTAYGSVCYCNGVQPMDSSNNPYGSPLVAGNTAPSPAIICGVYPYFYGKVASGGAPAGVNRPTPNVSLVTGGTKVVADSNGTLYINFGSNSDQYIWFATPAGSTTKIKWYIDALNNGIIGGGVSAGGNLFPTPASVVGVGTICWSGQTYKVYVSNYQSASGTIMELRNS